MICKAYFAENYFKILKSLLVKKKKLTSALYYCNRSDNLRLKLTVKVIVCIIFIEAELSELISLHCNMIILNYLEQVI